LSWYDDFEDQELIWLAPFLVELATVPDVREVLTKCVTILNSSCAIEDTIDLLCGLDIIKNIHATKVA